MEEFYGYNRYYAVSKYWSTLERIPTRYRNVASRIIRSAANNRLSHIIGLAPGARNFSQIEDKLYKISDVLASESIDELYNGLTQKSYKDRPIVKLQKYQAKDRRFSDFNDFDGVEKMSVMDLLMYLPDDILVKLDRASMSASLEARVPLLSHKIIDFSFSLPKSEKIKNGVTKWPLRQILHRHVPSQLFDGPKMGFGVPIGDWLRGGLRDWSEECLSRENLEIDQFFYTENIRKMWSEHLLGNNYYQQQLWNIIMFQAWRMKAR